MLIPVFVVIVAEMLMTINMVNLLYFPNCVNFYLEGREGS